jgi:hypothetical protein
MGIVIAISVYNVTLSVFAMGAAICTGLFSQVRWRWVKVASGTLAGIILVLPLFEATIQAPSLAIDMALLRDPWLSSLVLGFSLLPACFLWCRIWQFLPLRRRKYRRIRQILVLGLILATIAWTMAVQYGISNIGPDPISISLDYHDQATGEKRLEIQSSSPLAKGQLFLRDRIFPIPGTDSGFDLGAPIGAMEILDSRLSVTRFLDRKTVRLWISGGEPFEGVSLVFRAAEAMSIHAVNFPYRYDDAQSIEIFIGKHPPMPLPVEMTMPKDVKGTFSLTAYHTETVLYRPEQGPDRVLECITRYHREVAIP